MKKRERIRLGLVGCGRAAERLHLPALSRIEEARLVAASDPSPRRRHLIAKGLDDFQVFDSAKALLGKVALDGLLVATPPDTHVELVSLALDHGVPVLVEKPLAIDLGESLHLRNQQHETGVPVMVGYNRRWWEPVRRLRRALDASDRGPVRIQSLITTSVPEWDPVAQIQDPLDDLATHHLDLLRYLVGHEVREIVATRPDPASVGLELSLEDGSRARIEAAQAKVARERIRLWTRGLTFELRTGSRRTGPLDGARRRTIDFADRVVRRIRGDSKPFALSYETQLRGFLDVIWGAAVASPDIDDGVAVLRVVEAARESARRNGTPVRIEDPTLERRSVP